MNAAKNNDYSIGFWFLAVFYNIAEYVLYISQSSLQIKAGW